MGTKRRIKYCCGKWVYLMAALVLLTFANAGVAAGDESVQHYKMISTVEYVGQGQFRNQVEQLFTVREKPLSNDKVQYFITAKDLFKELSFVVDRGAQRLSQTCEDSAFWAKLNNHCVKSLTKTTKANIDKTWKQTFNLSSIDNSLPAELRFTLTAIKAGNQEFGEMIAVRALSEPFFVKLSGGTVVSRINTVYLFDSGIEDIFLSVSVFESTTTMNGFQEILSYKVATCKTDAAGKPVDLKGLGKEFEEFVGKLGLTKGLKVVKASTLPAWVKTEGLKVTRAANICSALACEGALNPVATVSLPATQVVGFLAASEPGVGERAWWDVWGNLVDWVGFWPAAGIVGASIAIPIATSGGGGSSSP